MSTHSQVFLTRRTAVTAFLNSGEPELRIDSEGDGDSPTSILFGNSLASDSADVIRRQLGDMIGELIRIRSVWEASLVGASPAPEPAPEWDDSADRRMAARNIAAIRASYLPELHGATCGWDGRPGSCATPMSCAALLAPDGDHFHYPTESGPVGA